MKRAREENDTSHRPEKILRASSADRLSKLSDEVLVRILSYGSVSTLLVCERVSKKLSRIAVDSELWKAAYYNQFVLPRASRIPGIKEARRPNHLTYSSKLSRWLDDSYLIKRGSCVNWKQQYRLRHNWSQGQCAVSEIVVAERPPEPPLLVMLQNNMLYTADSLSGLRAWNTKNERALVASTLLISPETETLHLPTSMAIDSRETDGEQARVTLGFEDGSFTIYSLPIGATQFRIIYEHPPSSSGMLSALAFFSPYLLTMTEDHLLSLYCLRESGTKMISRSELLYSLRSHTAWPPVSLSLRTNTTTLTAAIAYALPTYLNGWTVGIQEMRLTPSGELIESRLATSANDHPHTLSGHRSLSSPSTRSSSPFTDIAPDLTLSSDPSTSKPTSMSYSHPYLLVAHPDNTLTLYLVKSTSSSLSVGPGTRLWGHTSSVSGAHVGMRGKAVSVSRLGDELRVWDLEGGMATSAARKRTSNGELSVRVQPAKATEESEKAAEDQNKRRFGLRFALDQGFDESTISRGWVGFDEQNVIVLREKSKGSQSLVVYDFT